MQRNTNRTAAAANRRRKGRGSGWFAFAMGIAGMFVLMALWVALVEMPGDQDADAEFIGRAQTADAEPLRSTEEPSSGSR